MTGTRLSRAAMLNAGRPAPAPRVRGIHIGLGAFHRAHQAWYTARAADADDWGILGFTGRSVEAADLLAPQDGLYTLVERAATGDRFTVVGSIAGVVPGDRTDRLTEALADPATAFVTLTVTEAGYRLAADGAPDLADPAVDADVRALRTALAAKEEPITARPATALGRLLSGLEARRRAGAPPLAVVPCDNLPDNGGRVRAGLLGVADLVSAELAAWLPANVAFVSTSVDRITPRAEASLQKEVLEATGWADAAPVATEPFSDWILQGEFPSGRPAWETAGAVFVDDIEPYEARKLWLLNGAHTLLAALGRLRGHSTVAQAMTDAKCRAAVEGWWDEAARHLPVGLDVDAYRRALAERFANPRTEHALAQIGTDALTKLRVRIAPVALREREAGRDASASALAIGAWIAAVRTGVASPDSLDAEIAGAQWVLGLLALVDPALAADAAFAARVEEAARETATARSR